MHVPATLVRGGTSKCWLFDRADVPKRRSELEALLVNAYGAVDAIQLDGVGGATPTTSKAAVVSVAEDEGVDVDFLFGQVGIGVPRVEWGSNCGNCATAIALWAVHRGLVAARADMTRVVLRNTNTGAVLEGWVDTPAGQVPEFGTETVPGLRSGGVRVDLMFRDPVGATTGALLPTGSATDVIDLAHRPVTVSLLDAGAPMALVDAADAGRTGAEPPAVLRGEVDWLREVRGIAGRRMGLAGPDAATDAIPKVGLVGPPIDYESTTGEAIPGTTYDVSVRMLSMNAPHPAIGLTSAVGVALAKTLPGSVVRVRGANPDAPVTRIGTPAGVVTVADQAEHRQSRRVTLRRAARILCDASIHVPELGHAVAS